VVLVAASPSAATSTALTSGVLGVVRGGLLSECARPACAGARVEARRLPSAQIVARTRVGVGGRFRIALPPGRYVITVAAVGSRVARVRTNAFTLVVLARSSRTG